jgi:type VI secretion system protein ImpH
MNTPPLFRSPDWLDNWYQTNQPWRTGFISLMRTLAARTPTQPPVSRATLPQQENFRIGQRPSMAFAPREIAHVEQLQNKTCIDLFGLGIWGAQGAMPLHLTELAYTRAEFHDSTLIHFANMFHHRALAQFFRAWFVSQDTASLDRTDDEKFSFYIGCLAGVAPQEGQQNNLPVHARLASAAHLIREARNPQGLVGALHYYFDIPVHLEEFTRQWIFLQESDQSQLGYHHTALLLGNGALLGDTVQDRQHKFSLVLGPLTLEQYLGFNPAGQDLPVLRDWVRHFIGIEYAWEVSLVLAADQVPVATLEGCHQLGYTSWLQRSDNSTPVYGMSFEPEIYGE